MASQLTIDTLGDAVQRALGPRLVALLLYGSAARGTHVPKRSDLNTLLICDGVDEGLFDALGPVVRVWTKAGHRLAGKPVPARPAALLGAAAALVGFTAEGLAPLVRHVEGGSALRLEGGARDPLVAAYLGAVARTAEYVNRLG